MVKIKKPVTFHDNPMVVKDSSRPQKRTSSKKAPSSDAGFSPRRSRSKTPSSRVQKPVKPFASPVSSEVLEQSPTLDISFSDLMLSTETLAHLDSIGFIKPTQVQAHVIPAVFMGRDVVACAQTGTGKTASYALPLIDLLDSHRSRARMPRSLVLVPTRELAVQVAEAFEQFGQKKLSFVSIIGGSSITQQEKLLDRGVDVIIATPGRLLDLMDRGKILLSDIKYLVVDEADRMLDMGFIPDIEKILSLIPANRQTMLFSATLPDMVRKLIKTFLVNPKQVTISPDQATAANIEQYSLVATEAQKLDAIKWIMTQERETLQSLFIFCNRKKDVDALVKSMTRMGHPAVGLHGDMTQHTRTLTLQKFRDQRANILVASDVAARGIDVETVSHVINFSIPVNIEDYVHRIGRTGRAGKSGKAYTLVGPRESVKLAALQKMTGNALQKQVWEVLETVSAPVPAPVREASSRSSGGGRNSRGSQNRVDEGDRPVRNERRRPRGERVPELQTQEAQTTQQGQGRRQPRHERSSEPRVHVIPPAPQPIEEGAVDQERRQPRRERSSEPRVHVIPPAPQPMQEGPVGQDRRQPRRERSSEPRVHIIPPAPQSMQEGGGEHEHPAQQERRHPRQEPREGGNNTRNNERRHPTQNRSARPGPYDSDDIEEMPVAGFGSQTPSFFKKI
jgi:superfamily II DNA/RNA helicase